MAYAVAVRPRHPKKAIEAALKMAEASKWMIEPRSGHAWGIMRCPAGDPGWLPGLHLVNAEECRQPRQTAHEECDEVPTPIATAPGVQQTVRAEATHTFILLLRGANPLAYLDALFEAGCDDALFGERERTYFAEFDREAPTLADAIVTAIDQVESAVPGLQVVRVEPDELVNAAAIAARTRRTRESIRLLIDHRRGPGNFPAPIGWLNPKTRLWRWSDVTRWFAEFDKVPGERFSVEDALFIAGLNAAFDLRDHMSLVTQASTHRHLVHILEQVNRKAQTSSA